jgi:hypothetical protein
MQRAVVENDDVEKLRDGVRELLADETEACIKLFASVKNSAES